MLSIHDIRSKNPPRSTRRALIPGILQIGMDQLVQKKFFKITNIIYC